MAQYNCSSNVPFSAEVFADGSAANIAILVTSGLLALGVLGIFLWQLWVIRRSMWDWPIRNHIIILLAVYPVFSTLSFTGFIIPRCMTLIDLVSTVYLSVCICIFLQLMISYYGGESRMLVALHDDVMVMRSPPCCCCLCCLPKIRVTALVLRRVNIAVYQLVIIRPLLMMTAAVLWTDGQYNPGVLAADEPATYIMVINTTSTLTAMYGLVLVFRVSKIHLKRYSIALKFACLQLVIVCSNLQSSIISLVVKSGAIPCSPPFNSVVRGERINHLALVIEMTLISLLALRAYRPGPHPPGSTQTDDVEHDKLLTKSVDKTANGSVTQSDDAEREQLKIASNGYGAVSSTQDIDVTKGLDDNNPRHSDKETISVESKKMERR